MQNIEGLALVTEKAPHGGYALKQITIIDGHAQMETIAYRSSLPELNMLRHSLEEGTFKELAWFAAPPQPLLQVAPQPQHQPAPVVPQSQSEEQFELPRAFQHNSMPEADQGLVNKIADRMGMGKNGRANVVAFLFCTAVAFSMNVRGLLT